MKTDRQPVQLGVKVHCGGAHHSHVKDSMPKRRELCPESVYARLRLERWLEDDLGVSKVHRKRIWKALPSVDVDSIQDIPLVRSETCKKSNPPPFFLCF